MNTDLIAVMVWIAVGALGFLVGLIGISQTRRRLEGGIPTRQAATTDKTSFSVL